MAKNFSGTSVNRRDSAGTTRTNGGGNRGVGNPGSDMTQPHGKGKAFHVSQERIPRTVAGKQNTPLNAGALNGKGDMPGPILTGRIRKDNDVVMVKGHSRAKPAMRVTKNGTV